MEPASPSTRDRPLLVLRLAALLGLAIAGYLLYLGMTGQTALGCGEGAAGCNRVLGTRWSTVLGLPVSALAVGAYLILLAASIHAGPRSPRRHRDGAWAILGFVGLGAGLAAIWFITVQFLVVKHLCLYCMAAHACSLVIAGVVLARSRGVVTWLGLTPIAALIAAQLLVRPGVPLLNDGGVIFGNLDPHNAPTLGDPDAPHVMALLFDYNCAYCRDAHRLVADAVERHAGQLTVVMLPTAVNPDCNRYVQSPTPHSATSCELARLALAVWLADPGRFAEADRELMRHAETFIDPNGTPARYLSEARAIAESRVGADALDRALADPRIDQRLAIAAGVYKRTPIGPRRGVPRLILAGRAYPAPADAGQLRDLIERAYPDLAADHAAADDQ